MRRLPRSVVMRAVEDAIAGTDVGPREVFSPTQAHRVAHCRQAAMVRLRAFSGEDGKPLYSLPEIGRAFDRDHTTVIHALRQYSRRIHRQSENGGQVPQGLNATLKSSPEPGDT